MAEENKDNSEENKKRALLALAVLIGSGIESYDLLSEAKNRPMLEQATKMLESNEELNDIVSKPERISEQELLTQMAKQSVDDGSRLLRVVTVGDDKVCEKCREWQGKIVSVDGNDTRHPSVKDFISSGGLHYNCRCSLQELDVKEIPLKPTNPRHDERKAANPAAYNSYIFISQQYFRI